ncbi:MAG: hypothetical protein LBR59_00110 [Endomicrobium sp.]|jgi:hypothetical protein|nr:hypothetical protein [Endomicrobium sp.]
MEENDNETYILNSKEMNSILTNITVDNLPEFLSIDATPWSIFGVFKIFEQILKPI